jgi:hypothetical protein
MQSMMTRLQRAGITGRSAPIDVRGLNNEASAVEPIPIAEFCRKLRRSRVVGVLVARDGFMEVKQCARHGNPGC